jgi:cellulose synthase/poly-beta-1,6-N-acetylglucosamine synthase-like glycosyltransferase
MIGFIFWASVGLVFYVYAGYPLLVTLVARLRKPPRYPSAPPAKVTILIAAYNEESEIASKLEAVLALDYPAELMQIIVAADGSTDRTAEIVSGFEGRGIELVHQPQRQGKMAAISRAITSATGEIVVFSDANNRFDSNAVERLVAPFADGRVGLTVGYKTVTGASGLGHAEGTYWKYESHLRRMETRLGCTVGVNGEICAIRRDLFRPAPPQTINDDQWMAHMVIRDGFNVVFCPDAVSRETISESAADEKERRSRMVAGQYQLFARAHREIPWRRPVVAWMLVSHKLLRPLVPFGMAGAAGAAAAAVVLPQTNGGLVGLGLPWAATALGAQGLFYAIALAGRKLERLGKLTYIPRFLVDSNIAAVAGLWRHLRGSQSALWDGAQRAKR